MSILDEIQRQCAESTPRLYKLEVSQKDPAIADAPTFRTMYISPAINAFLESDHPLAGGARADLEDFILGNMVVAALERDHKNCRMARLDRPSDEVWEMRILDTIPQLRIFGRFAMRDVFVALVGPVDRDSLDDFEEEKKDCLDDWIKLFGVFYWPIKGTDIHAYISKPVRLV